MRWPSSLAQFQNGGFDGGLDRAGAFLAEVAHAFGALPALRPAPPIGLNNHTAAVAFHHVHGACSFIASRIASSVDRLANSAQIAARSNPYFRSNAGWPIWCCSAWWRKQPGNDSQSAGFNPLPELAAVRK